MWAKQSCSSQTRMSSGPTPAFSYTALAADWVMPVPTMLIIDGGSKASGVSVVSAWARMLTSVRRPCCLAKRSETMIAAAPPQVGGQAIRRVITPSQTTWSAITSSVLTTFLNTASGLLAACRLALARIAAKVLIWVPYFSMCSLPAPPKSISAPGMPTPSGKAAEAAR
ncbi:hypothetical protein D9M69_553850 [compost metagenome]